MKRNYTHFDFANYGKTTPQSKPRRLDNRLETKALFARRSGLYPISEEYDNETKLHISVEHDVHVMGSNLDMVKFDTLNNDKCVVYFLNNDFHTCSFEPTLGVSLSKKDLTIFESFGNTYGRCAFHRGAIPSWTKFEGWEDVEKKRCEDVFSYGAYFATDRFVASFVETESFVSVCFDKCLFLNLYYKPGTRGVFKNCMFVDCVFKSNYRESEKWDDSMALFENCRGRAIINKKFVDFDKILIDKLKKS